MGAKPIKRNKNIVETARGDVSQKHYFFYLSRPTIQTLAKAFIKCETEVYLIWRIGAKSDLVLMPSSECLLIRKLVLHVPLLISIIVITSTSVAFYTVVCCLGEIFNYFSSLIVCSNRVILFCLWKGEILKIFLTGSELMGQLWLLLFNNKNSSY